MVSSLRPKVSILRSRVNSQKLLDLELASSDLELASSDLLQIKLVLASSQKLIDLRLAPLHKIRIRVRARLETSSA